MVNKTKVKIKKIENLLYQAAKKFITSAEAHYFAKEQIDTHLKKSPRINSLRAAIDDLQSWADNPKAKIKIQAEKEAAILYNFHKLGPSLKIKDIHDQLVVRARKHGIAMVGLNNSGGINTLNLWTDGLGKRGLIGICLFNGGPGCVVPFGGTEGLFGTNPISYAIPTNDRPIIADLASSEIPFFELRQAKEAKKKLRLGCAVDKNGRPTTNPENAFLKDGRKNIVPMGGGYKGYSIVLLIEILTGSLVHSFLSTEMSSKYVLEEHGGLILAIDIAGFANLLKFKDSVSKMCTAIRRQKPAPGIDRVLVPGDSSYQRAEKILKAGVIEIETELLEKLEKLS